MKRKLKLITLIPLCMTMTFQSFADGFAKQKEIITAKDVFGEDDDYDDVVDIMEDDFVKVPYRNLKVLKTEVTQDMYISVMGENPSYFSGGYRPVERVSMYDAIYFCNKLSVKHGKEPVYTVNGESDVKKWGYAPHRDELIEGVIKQKDDANGYRLPKSYEWLSAAKGGQDFTYAGSNNILDVGWCSLNSDDTTKTVKGLKPNGYGLYDMSGNVREWVWLDTLYEGDRFGVTCGGSYKNKPEDLYMNLASLHSDVASIGRPMIGFRIVYNPSK